MSGAADHLIHRDDRVQRDSPAFFHQHVHRSTLLVLLGDSRCDIDSARTLTRQRILCRTSVCFRSAFSINVKPLEEAQSHEQGSRYGLAGTRVCVGSPVSCVGVHPALFPWPASVLPSCQLRCRPGVQRASLGQRGSLASVEALVDDIPAAATHTHPTRPEQWDVFRATSNLDEMRR